MNKIEDFVECALFYTLASTTAFLGLALFACAIYLVLS
jgi:hypothetical protein